MKFLTARATFLLFIVACLPAIGSAEPGPGKANQAIAIFAGGCFWCMEPPFDKLDGVISTTSGYTGGHKPDPTYQQVSAGRTGHTEAIQIVYDPDKISYAELLDVFWRNIDPTTVDGQFCDWGNQYRSEIFYNSARTTAAGREIEISTASAQAFQGTGGYRDQQGIQILPGRRLPPGLLPEEPGALQVLPLWLRP